LLGRLPGPAPAPRPPSPAAAALWRAAGALKGDWHRLSRPRSG
jgi:hypothetical protein